MSADVRELIQIVDSLPHNKAQAVVDFARFLQQQTGDSEWERIIAAPQPRPKLDAFIAAAVQEGEAKPFDPSKL